RSRRRPGRRLARAASRARRRARRRPLMPLHLHEWGDPDAPPVVCLHGVTAHGARYRRLAQEALRARRVLAPDLRGHGRSEWEPPWSIAQQLEDLLETVDGAGVGRAAWIGHSYGGRLLHELAARE